MKQTLRRATLMRSAALVSGVGALLIVGSSSSASVRQLSTAPHNVTVYVQDFELAVPTVKNIAAGGTNAKGNGNAGDPAQQVEALQAQAKKVKDFMANTLVESLRKNGYTASRTDGRPANGMVLAGVFAEPDDKNRIRRAMLGSGAPANKFHLYVGTFDQKILNQPLYKEAPPQTQVPDDHYGSVITLNAYIPLAKYEIDKDATEEELRRVCGQIVANLAALLERNPGAVTESK